MHHDNLTPSYILHTFPYSNTSLIVECFTESQGRVTLLARSARGPASRYRGQLQLFTPLLLSWSGRHELKNLNKLELSGMPIILQKRALLCGFYVNELTLRLLHKEDPHLALFAAYDETLRGLEKAVSITTLAVTLRLFEIKLLRELGYALPLHNIQADLHYHFMPQQGFSVCRYCEDPAVFQGIELLKIAENDLSSEAVLRAAKRLLRFALHPLLGDRPLHSRDLF